MSLDFGGQDVAVIQEKDIKFEENSFESDNEDDLVVSGFRAGSPGRVRKGKGQEAQIKQMWET